MKALDRKLLRDLRLMRSQVATIALVVASAVAGFIASYSTYDSLAWSRDLYYAQARFADVFSALKRAPLAREREIAALPGVGRVQTSLEEDVPIDLPGVADPIIGRLVGLEEHRAQALNLVHLRRGRLPVAGGNAVEAMVSEGFAKARKLQPGDRVGALINGRRETLVIVGIALSPEYVFAGLGGSPDQRSFGIFWLPRKALGAAYNMEGAFNRVAVKLAPGASEAAVIDALDRMLAPYGGANAYGREDHPSDQALRQEIKEQRVMGSVLPSVFLAVAAFLLNVVLTRQVGIQREQIATLKAVGYGNGRIVLHYLQLVTVIVLAGLVLGLVLGVQLGRAFVGLYAEFFWFPRLLHRLDPVLVFAAVGVTLAAAVLGTLRAIRATVTLAPAEAMRPPAPGRYRPTLVERLGGGRLLSPGARMVLRNMERRALRTALTVAGIGASLAIIVAGTFWRDAIDDLMDNEFAMVLRGNVDVALIDPAPLRVRHEFAHLPGVLQVEVKRNVAVRLENGPYHYRGTLQGVEAEPQLLRVVDAFDRPHRVPEGGVLLTDRLADRLHLRVGDRVRLELLEGRREVLELPVQGLVREMMGMNAYIQRPLLNRLLHEAPQVNRITLLVEPQRERDVFLALKGLPRVATAFSKSTFMRNLKEVTARNILIFSTVLTAFASVIAVGVVYNHARIALAERAWELASLRVLGFTRGEVSGFLLGELATEVALALPMGMILGYGLALTIVNLVSSDQIYFPLNIQPRTYAYAGLCVLVAAVVSALIVRRRIDRLDMVAVLKTRE